jgi:hypothetical protein
MAAKTFEPSEAELREALATVKQRLSALQYWANEWVEMLCMIDAKLFEQDRAAWDEVYGKIDGNTVLAMRDELYAKAGGEDQDGVMHPGSPRWEPLNKLCEEKRIAAKPAPKRKCIAAKPAPKKIAAARKRSTKEKTTKQQVQTVAGKSDDLPYSAGLQNGEG